MDGQVVLVCGAGRAAGRALAIGFARAGAAVAAHDLTPVHLDETRRQVEAAGATCRTYTGDTGKGLPARALIEDVLADFDRLDVLVHAVHAAPKSGLLDLDEWDWQRTLELNLSGPFLLMQAAAAVIKEQGGGVMINLLQDEDAEPGSLPLAVSQSGLAALSSRAASDLMAYNIRCCAIRLSGLTLVTGTALAADGNEPEWPAELQKLALFLCGPEAEKWNGATLSTEDLIKIAPPQS
jgi:3-oxoacyl-[acyl-carrier protein] reductase